MDPQPAVAAGAPSAISLPPGVRTLDFGRFNRVGGWWLALGIVATVAISLVLAAALVLAGRWLRGLPAPWMLGVTVLTCMLAMTIIASIWKVVTPLRVRRQLEAARRWNADSTELAWLEAQRLSANYNFFMSRRKRTAWVEQAHRHEVRVFVDARVSDWFAQAERTEERLEPETAASFMAQHEASFGMVATTMGTMQLVGRNWAAAGVWLLIGVFLLTRLLVRGRLFEPIIAGQGWLQNGRLRLSARDTVLTVRKQFGRTVSLTFTSPEGLLRLQLSTRSGKDQALRDLWARWTHPHPQDAQSAYDA